MSNQKSSKNIVNALLADDNSKIMVKNQTTQRQSGPKSENTDYNVLKASNESTIETGSLEQTAEQSRVETQGEPVVFLSDTNVEVQMDRITLKKWAPEFADQFKDGNQRQLELKTEPLQALARFCEQGRAEKKDVQLLLEFNRQVFVFFSESPYLNLIFT